MTEDWENGGFGVYVHWPFCASKCPYCDFNSHVRGEVDQARWRRALVREVRAAAARVPSRRVGSVFFGGGTPSLMPPETVAEVLSAIAASWRLDSGAEVTLEANPTSVEAERFRGYRDAGVNRLSIGVQALDDAALKALGRLHSAAEALAALEVAWAHFDRVSFDLIYARQNQTLAQWQAELGRALALAPNHLSLYQLTVEPETRFGELAARGRLRGLPGSELAADLFALTQELCAAAGLPSYEVSNHSQPGAEGRHNLVYWRYGDYAGIGPGAHGRLTIDGVRHATVARRMPEEWLDAVETTGSGVAEESPLGREEAAAEMLMMGLRLAEGIDPRRYAALAGRPLDAERLRTLRDLGMIEDRANRLRVTKAGRPVLNSVTFSLLDQPVTA